MATWKSPIFSDIRNKLGENVVFSMWKGRPYMRSYVRPSNPRTLAQTANRLDMTRLVQHWQSNIAITPGLVTAWNAAALSDLISGYNRFVKGMRGYVIEEPDLQAGSVTIPLASCKLPLNEMRMVVYDLTGPAIIEANKQTIAEYTAADFTAWTPAAGDFLVVVDEKALGTTTLTAGNWQDYGAALVYTDEATGVVTPCVVTT
jgi:hypothetical protein